MTIIRLRDLNPAPPAPQYPLAIPTYDGLPGLLHTDVVYVPEGWNGWRYWLAFTPYPGAARENISVVVSNDLVTWRVPPGGTNPLLTNAEILALGNYGHSSDPDLVLLPNGTMRVYFRPAGTSDQDEAVWCMDSTDGITWGAPQKLIEEQATNTSLLSPAVVVEDDGTFSMWTVNVGAGAVHRRTSPDGLTWSVPTACTGAVEQRWHADVVLFAGRYHMLMNSNNPANLYFRWSDDGLAWTGSSTPLPVPGTVGGRTFGGYYRSTMIPRPSRQFGQPVSWDILASMKHPLIGSPTDVEVALLQGVSLAY